MTCDLTYDLTCDLSCGLTCDLTYELFYINLVRIVEWVAVSQGARETELVA